MRKVDYVLETDDDITESRWAKMAEKVMLDDKQTLRNTTKTAGLVSGSTGNSSGGH